MRTEHEKMLAGELYDAMDPELVQARTRAHNLCLELNATQEGDAARRRDLLQRLLGKVGDSVTIQPPFFCDYGANIHLGARVFLNFHCIVLDVCRVTIGDDTQIGSGVQILTPLHPLNAQARRGKEFGAPVTIGQDVWIGSGALILPGVGIGARTVVGAGSVVTRSLPGGVLAAGNPCRVLRHLNADEVSEEPPKPDRKSGS